MLIFPSRLSSEQCLLHFADYGEVNYAFAKPRSLSRERSVTHRGTMGRVLRLDEASFETG